MVNNISLLHHVKIHSSHYSVTHIPAWWSLKSSTTRLAVCASTCSTNKKENTKAPYYGPFLGWLNDEHWFSVTKDRWSPYSLQSMTSSCVLIRGEPGTLHIFSTTDHQHKWLSKPSLRDEIEIISYGQLKLIRFIYLLLSYVSPVDVWEQVHSQMPWHTCQFARLA